LQNDRAQDRFWGVRRQASRLPTDWAVDHLRQHPFPGLWLRNFGE